MLSRCHRFSCRAGHTAIQRKRRESFVASVPLERIGRGPSTKIAIEGAIVGVVLFGETQSGELRGEPGAGRRLCGELGALTRRWYLNR